MQICYNAFSLRQTSCRLSYPAQMILSWDRFQLKLHERRFMLGGSAARLYVGDGEVFGTVLGNVPLASGKIVTEHEFEHTCGLSRIGRRDSDQSA